MDDEHKDDEKDSTFDESSSEISSTVSVTSSARNFPEENGRTYHALYEGKYWRPNDEQEQERLNLQHELLRRTFSDKLYICPLDQKGIGTHNVLDVGAGTGAWANDFGGQHPEALVIGLISALSSLHLPSQMSALKSMTWNSLGGSSTSSILSISICFQVHLKTGAEC